MFKLAAKSRQRWPAAGEIPDEWATAGLIPDGT